MDSGRFAPLGNARFFPFGYAAGQNDRQMPRQATASRSPSGMTSKKNDCSCKVRHGFVWLCVRWRGGRRVRLLLARLRGGKGSLRRSRCGPGVVELSVGGFSAWEEDVSEAADGVGDLCPANVDGFGEQMRAARVELFDGGA